MFGGLFEDYGTVGVNNDLIDLTGIPEGVNDMVVEGFTGEVPVIFSGHALAGMAHGYDSDDRMAHGREKFA